MHDALRTPRSADVQGIGGHIYGDREGIRGQIGPCLDTAH